jgi:hypothetical protein
MKLAPSLHKSLLAGLARAPLAPGEGASAPLQTLLADVAPAALTWHTLAAEDLWQSAGFQPLQAAPLPACPAQPCCPRAAEHVLQQILRDVHPELLENWLALARDMGFMLPHASLAHLLDKGLSRPALREAMLPVLGERGHWLAASNPAWKQAYAAPGATDDAPLAQWELGTPEQRREALLAMRRADPAAALALLESEWAGETAEGRASLLGCLATSLGAQDEAFLERALDDKRKEVRVLAQQLLANLPGSQLAQRCAARLGQLLTIERNFLTRRHKLVLQLPGEADKAMLRDGIGAQKHHGIGEKAGWLQDMMACVPPLHWSSIWNLEPRQVLELLIGSEFKVALVTGLVQACARAIAHDRGETTLAWFHLLIAEASEADAGVQIAPALLPGMVYLTEAQQEAVVLRWLEGARLYSRPFSYAMGWAQQRGALPPALSRAVLTMVRNSMGAEPPLYGVREQFKPIARLLDASDIAYAHAAWPPSGWEHWPHWRALVDELMETLQFRHAMQRSFLEKP